MEYNLRHSTEEMLFLFLFLFALPPLLSSCPCDLIRVSSRGGAAEHQYMFMGKLKYFQHNVLPCHIPGDYRPAGLLWEDSVNVTFYKSDSGRFLSPSVFSRPGEITWVLTERPGGLNAGIMNQDTQYSCPHLIPSSWLYLWEGQWFQDQTILLSCLDHIE